MQAIHHNQVKAGVDARTLNPHYITFLESPPILDLLPHIPSRNYDVW